MALIFPIDLLLCADSRFREQSLLYPATGAPVPYVKVIERSSSIWDVISWAGDHRQTIRVKIDSETEGAHEETYVIKHGEITSSKREDTTSLGISLSAKLDQIRFQLGIGTKHLARALGVERPTIYAWQNDGAKPQDKRWERIALLLEFAQFWEGVSESPLGKRAFEPVMDEMSVMDMLSAEEIDSALVKSTLRKWAEDQKTRSTAMRAKAVQKREEMARRGLEPLPERVVDQTMRELGRTAF